MGNRCAVPSPGSSASAFRRKRPHSMRKRQGSGHSVPLLPTPGPYEDDDEQAHHRISCDGSGNGVPGRNIQRASMGACRMPSLSIRKGRHITGQAPRQAYPYGLAERRGILCGGTRGTLSCTLQPLRLHPHTISRESTSHLAHPLAKANKVTTSSIVCLSPDSQHPAIISIRSDDTRVER